MKSEKFSQYIGNIDDRFIYESMLVNAAAKPKKVFKRAVAIAAVVALMAGCFTVGALAFSRESVIEVPVEIDVPVEIPVEVPVEPETAELTDIGLTLIMPDSWKGRYAVEHDGDNFSIYNPSIREAMGGDSETYLSGGTIFYINLWSQQLTKDEFDAGGEWEYAACRYIMATEKGTYLLYYVSDVQCTMDTLEEFRQMESEIKDIQFVIPNS